MGAGGKGMAEKGKGAVKQAKGWEAGEKLCLGRPPNEALQRRPRSKFLMIPCEAVRGPTERKR